MSKVRVYEVAKQLNLDPKAVVSLFQAIGVTDVRNHMSSVEPEAVDRVKRHLEKQKTHDVVEERIRPTVVKRRAIAKAPTDAPSTPSLANPPSAASLPSLDISEVPSVAPSTPFLETNGHPRAELPRDRESTAALRAPEERKSVRDVGQEAEALPPSPPAAASAAAVPPPAPSTSSVASAAASSAAASAPAAPPVPPSRVSTRSVSEPEPVRAPEPPAVAEPSLVKPAQEEMPPPAPSFEPPAPAAPPAAASAVDAELPRPAAPPAAQEPAPIPTPPPAAQPTPAPVAAAPVQTPTPPPRPTSAPKTGVEYWTGRPGVPMPQPQIGPRIGPNPSGNTPRRVQYDPRASATSPAGRRGPMGGPPGRGGPAGRMGPGGRPMKGQMPMRRPGGPVSTKEMSEHKKVIRIEENITLQQMAARLSLKSTELLMKLLSMGMTGVHINTTLDADTAKILASEFGWEVEDVAQSEEQVIAAARGEDPAKETPTEVDANLVLRAPVVTVMGHVDHGKTSLLDKIRKANVAGGEAGGITQHIGAYKVNTSHGQIVFLDTPGHEAFTQMRARGASVTDIVILVVAADDGVMPQTKEAVAHAKAAKVPIIVAVNKIDKPSADPERVKRELVELGLQPEEWGGDTIFVPVSALSGEGIDTLLEMVGLQSEVLELRANPKRAASGAVLEALLDRGRGPVARVLVQDGTLRVGDFVLAGAGFGKVRAMTNEHGKQVHEAGPATPVEILGLSDVPNAGDAVHAVKDAKKAQEIAESRKGKMARSLIPATAKVSLEELSKRIQDTGQQELRVIVKGDVQGSVEAVADALAKLSTEKVRLSIIHAGVGAITEGDINLAIAAKAIVIGFNVRPAGKAGSLAEENKIEIRTYSIIYNAVDDVKSAMEGLLPPTLVEKANGRAEVRQVFKIKAGVIAGCYVTEGTMKRASKARLVRAGAVIWDGKIGSLKRFKEDVKDVAEGFECGISLDGYTDLKEGDFIESYEIEEVKQKL